MRPRPPTSTLFPYTTLFRSRRSGRSPPESRPPRAARSPIRAARPAARAACSRCASRAWRSVLPADSLHSFEPADGCDDVLRAGARRQLELDLHHLALELERLKRDAEALESGDHRRGPRALSQLDGQPATLWPVDVMACDDPQRPEQDEHEAGRDP